MIALKEKLENMDAAMTLISAALIDAGIKPHHIGFTYLKQEILIMLTESDIRHHAMLLYKRIADDHSVSPGSVERAARYAIVYAYDHEHEKLCIFMRSGDHHVPSHFEFVCWAAEAVRNKLST